MDTRKKLDGGTVGKKVGAGVHQFTVARKDEGFVWNDAGVELCTVLRGCF